MRKYVSNVEKHGVRGHLERVFTHERLLAGVEVGVGIQDVIVLVVEVHRHACTSVL